MPRLIFKCPYIKGGTSSATAHLENYVKYMATRNGVERIDPGRSEWPATSKQKKMVEQILRDFPLSRGMFEYEDYAAEPTRTNASEFITRALEDNYNQIAKKDNYLKYIATRPRAQRVGSHGLFTGEEDQLVLAQVAEAVAAHPGNVWLPIISLRREDAARLGYDKAEEWKALLSKYAMEMAEAMKIPWEDFRWYAAFHDEAHHPHIHMVCYSADPSKGFLTTQGIAQIKSGLAKEIFRQELTELYQKQTQSRDTLNEDARSVLEQLIERMWSGAVVNHRMEKLMEHLAERLRHTGGRKQYGYLKAPLKAVVDEIVDELAKEPCVAAAYALWYELREDVLRTYKDDLPPRLPLSQQKEFKRIKNIVIEEAVTLGARQQVFHPDDQQDRVPVEDQEEAPLPEVPTEADARAFLQRRQFKAINVTIPYKKLVMEYCSFIDPRARAIGAVNTVVNKNGLLYGYNTDYLGFAHLCEAHGVELAGKTVLILGTGGTHNTTRAVALDKGAAKVLTVSRTPDPEKGELSYAEAVRSGAQVVFNTTPAGMYPNVGVCSLDVAAMPGLEAVVDVVYNPNKTELILRAEEAGVPVAVGGLEMLVAQAVYAAEYFLGRKFEDAPGEVQRITAALRRETLNIALVGMPSCGKSTLGRLLAKQLGRPLVDLDEEIVKADGRSIPDIFAAEGEEGFRAKEAAQIARFGKEKGLVLSCGGGAVKRAENVRALRQNGVVLFIDRPVEALAVGGNRPLSSSAEALRTMEAQRRPLYLAAADAVISNTGTLAQTLAAAQEALDEIFDS